jgi:putative FmdB family regulatory protein
MTYEYQCTDFACQHQWEEEQRITEPASRRCPECGQETARRLISKTAFILNGPGWYRSGGY